MAEDFIIEEWEDSEGAFEIDGQLTILVLILLAFIFVVFQNVSTIRDNALILLVLTIIASLFLFVERLSEGTSRDILGTTVSVVSFGDNPTKALIAAGIGLAIGGFLSSASLVITNPLSGLAASALPSITERFSGFLFNVLLAPFAEEKFFRAFVTSTIVLEAKENGIFQRIILSGIAAFFPVIFGQVFIGAIVGIAVFALFTWLPSNVNDELIEGLVAVLVAAVPFALFHLLAYGGDAGSILAALFFGVLFALGNYFFKSTAFGLGTHVGVNYIQHVRIFGGIF